MPSGNVQDLTFVSVKSRELVVSWRPPVAILQNGVITEYRVVLSNDSEMVSDTRTQSLCYSLSDLHPHVNYSVSVSAVNSVGEGPSLSITQLTESEGKYLYKRLSRLSGVDCTYIER